MRPKFRSNIWKMNEMRHDLALAIERHGYSKDTKNMRTKKKPTANSGFADLNTSEAVEHFREVAAAFAKKAMRSRATARKVLIDAGIYDKSGKLTKTYRS